MDLNEFLRSSNLGHTLESFAEHRIDSLDLLPLLSEEQIKTILPAIGDFVRFKQAIQLLNTPISDSQVQDKSTADITLSSTAEPGLEVALPSILSIPLQGRKRPAEEILTYIVNEDQELTPSTSSTVTNLSNSDCGIVSSFLSFSGDVSSYNLKTILEADVIGRAILKKYTNLKTLDNKERNNLCEIIIASFLNKSCKLTNESLSLIAEKLVELFPTEKKSTYFVDAIPKKKSRLNRPEVAKGKLVDKHRNKLTALRRAQQVQNLRPPSPEVNPEEITQLAIDSKIWLQTNREPLSDVLYHWKNSFPIRKNFNQRQKTLTTFLSEWPILESQIAIELVSFDFAQIYHEHQAIENLEQRFDEFFTSVLEKRRSRLSPTDQTLVDLLSDETLTTDSKIALKLFLLPSLIPPKGRTRLQKRHWKPSISECRDGLLLHVKTPGNLETCKAQRVDTMYKRGMTVQPYIILVGISLTNINSSYVVVDDNIYKTLSVLDAIDFCFKSFNTFEVKYPFECNHIWFLIQKSIYQITTKYDVQIPFIQDLL